jgi:hypothetical protein
LRTVTNYSKQHGGFSIGSACLRSPARGGVRRRVAGPSIASKRLVGGFRAIEIEAQKSPGPRRGFSIRV